MRLLDAIIKNWPLEANASDKAARNIVSCKQNFEVEYVISTIIQSHPHIDRDLIINAMRICCKEIAEPYYPRPFLLCLLRRLGIS